MIDTLPCPLRTQILPLALCLAALGCVKKSSTPTPALIKPVLGIPTLIKDINPGPDAGVDGELVAFREELYFPGVDGVHGTQLWKTDGTSSGTVMVKDIHPKTKQNAGRPIAASNRHLYVITSHSAGCDLWSSDGSTTGTVKIKSGSDIGFLSPVGDEMTFSVLDWATGREIWKTSGTRAGTTLIKVIGPAAISGSRPSALLVHEGQVLFVANDWNAKRMLFAISSSMHDIRVLKEVGSLGAPAVFHGAVYFGDEVKLSEYSWELSLWRTDATRAGTQKVALINTRSKNYHVTHQPARLHDLTVVGDKLYYISKVDHSSALRNYSVLALWSSDGTSQGTKTVKDLGTGLIVRSAVLRGELYFGAVAGKDQLWKLDRTTGNPVLLASFGASWAAHTRMTHTMSDLTALEQQGHSRVDVTFEGDPTGRREPAQKPVPGARWRALRLVHGRGRYAWRATLVDGRDAGWNAAVEQHPCQIVT